MLDYLVEFIEQCFVDLLVIGAFALAAVFFLGWGYGLLVDYNTSLHPAPTVNPASMVKPATVTPKPTATIMTETITSDIDVLARNKQYPTTFTRTEYDPVGAYFANLNFGGPAGDFNAVYINVQTWKRGGGRIIKTDSFPSLGNYYTVFTTKGTSTQLFYDKNLNVVFSTVESPALLN